MATRSTISVVHADGTVTSVYCHSDGYLSNNGRLLVNHYNSQDLADLLVAGGDISSLGTSIGTKHDFLQRTNSTTYYGRDRGSNNSAAQKFWNFSVFQNSQDWQEYNYLFVDGHWRYSQDRVSPSSSLVSEALLEEAKTA
jgi:hypothetical protein